MVTMVRRFKPAPTNSGLSAAANLARTGGFKKVEMMNEILNLQVYQNLVPATEARLIRRILTDKLTQMVYRGVYFDDTYDFISYIVQQIQASPGFYIVLTSLEVDRIAAQLESSYEDVKNKAFWENRRTVIADRIIFHSSDAVDGARFAAEFAKARFVKQIPLWIDREATVFVPLRLSKPDAANLEEFCQKVIYETLSLSDLTDSQLVGTLEKLAANIVTAGG
ncbi:hypothetical protein J5289_21695 [Rhizobium sp. B230/85]|uniref:hypothetical protein n=1 Tax=unclassified Rhizobium TaxID=2613769 RepID=UPI001ADD2ABA|nr:MULTISPECIES: hypothetical protein [unclassified Rhizobium]MBO9136898.1 hypothetical protein [Rhizobium sp. B209b/85]QXZ97938.1 hypothetical protein J5289_21695 [Rhizobium sp. B230/85]